MAGWHTVSPPLFAHIGEKKGETELLLVSWHPMSRGWSERRFIWFWWRRRQQKNNTSFGLGQQWAWNCYHIRMNRKFPHSTKININHTACAIVHYNLILPVTYGFAHYHWILCCSYSVILFAFVIETDWAGLLYYRHIMKQMELSVIEL